MPVNCLTHFLETTSITNKGNKKELSIGEIIPNELALEARRLAKVFLLTENIATATRKRSRKIAINRKRTGEDRRWLVVMR